MMTAVFAILFSSLCAPVHADSTAPAGWIVRSLRINESFIDGAAALSPDARERIDFAVRAHLKAAGAVITPISKKAEALEAQERAVALSRAIAERINEISDAFGGRPSANDLARIGALFAMQGAVVEHSMAHSPMSMRVRHGAWQIADAVVAGLAPIAVAGDLASLDYAHMGAGAAIWAGVSNGALLAMGILAARDCAARLGKPGVLSQHAERLSQAFHEGLNERTYQKLRYYRLLP